MFPPVGDGTDSSGMRASHTLCGHCVRQTSSTIVLYFYFLEKQTMRPVKGKVVSDLVECNANIYCKRQSVHQSAGLSCIYLVVGSDCSFISASLYVNMNALSANKGNFHSTSLKHTPFNVNSPLNARRWILKNKLLNCHLEENVANDKAVCIFQT